MTNILDETRSQIARNLNARPVWERVKNRTDAGERIASAKLWITLQVRSSGLFAMAYWSRLIGFGSSAVCTVAASPRRMISSLKRGVLGAVVSILSTGSGVAGKFRKPQWFKLPPLFPFRGEPKQPAMGAVERQFLPAALEILETPPSPSGRVMSFTICAFALVAMLWAAHGRIDIVAVAAGKIVTRARTQVVQVSETSVVKGIFVQPGQSVKQGPSRGNGAKPTQHECDCSD